MPQPPLDLGKYLSTPLPPLREAYPPGTGGTGPRANWQEGTLKGVQVADDFDEKVSAFLKTLPQEPIQPHPAHKYPKFVQAITNIPNVIKSPSDLQKCLSTLPLTAVSTVLTAIDYDAHQEPIDNKGAKALDKAGYESDGGEEVAPAPVDNGKTKAFHWQFNKSPMGSGEFYLKQQGSDDVKLVVRTINSSAFTSHDWEEYVVTGPYRYTTRNKASWYWSRAWGASKRLSCKYWILTDWQRWVFGKFNDGLEHAWVSPVMSYDSVQPGVLQSLVFWSKSALGDSNGFKAEKKDVSGMPELFPANPARRISISGKGKGQKGPQYSNKVKAANESDIEESDVEDA